MLRTHRRALRRAGVQSQSDRDVQEDRAASPARSRHRAETRRSLRQPGPGPDARAQYLVVADACTKSGDNKRALDILHKIADLDPNNTEIRLKLADGYLKENMRRESAAAFVQAANRFHQIGSHDQALDAYNKARN